MASECGLLLIGHGSAGLALPFGALAAQLRARAGYDEVACAFVKQGPPLRDALSLVSSSHVDVLPMFLGSGHYTETVIPQALGLAGAMTVQSGRTITLLPPAGHLPRMPGAVAGCAVRTARGAGYAVASTSLLLVAHGSRRGDGAVAARNIAAAIAASRCFGEVALAFLEEEPHLAHWRQLVQGRHVLVQPLMMAAGIHSERDIPALLALKSGEDRRITIAPPLGDGAGLAELVNGWCPTNR
ncbi:MAG: hypothetical protein H7Y60_08145 [Rhodospirillaceae bacterium]|nr:hypothetical protein [Rhodospirillales bacterium]